MALADYYACDVCGNKTIYDADICDRWTGPRIGGVKIICTDCSVTHEVVVIERPKDLGGMSIDDGAYGFAR